MSELSHRQRNVARLPLYLLGVVTTVCFSFIISVQVTHAQTVYGPYTFDADNDADESAWTFDAQNGTDGLNSAGTNGGAWVHDTNDTPSSNVGPTSGQGGSPDGYVYTEASNANAFNDEFYMIWNTNLDASANSYDIEFYWNQRGNENFATVDVQTNENGAGWVTQATYGENGPDVASGGTQQWNLETLDLAGLISDPSTELRFRVVMPSSGTIWNNDFGLDTITITETELADPGTITGTLYSDFASTTVTTGKTIALWVGTSTPGLFSTTTDATGAYFFDIGTSTLEIDAPIIVFIDGDANDANAVSKIHSTTTGMGGLDLYYDYVNLKQYGATSTVLADLAAYDSTDDSDLLYTALTGSDSLEILDGGNLFIFRDRKSVV